MNAMRIEVLQVIDFGPTVAIVGTELASNLSVVVQIDYRSLATIQHSWQLAGLSKRIQFAADVLILKVDVDPVADGDGGERAAAA